MKRQKASQVKGNELSEHVSKGEGWGLLPSPFTLK